MIAKKRKIDMYSDIFVLVLWHHQNKVDLGSADQLH